MTGVDATTTIDVTDINAHIRTLRSFIVADHERWIAEVQSWADRAGARGDLPRQRQHLAYVAKLKAMAYPWEEPTTPTTCCCGAAHDRARAEPPRS
jgi:hypothetical protein